jgi:hypothetical protein
MDLGAVHLDDAVRERRWRRGRRLARLREHRPGDTRCGGRGACGEQRTPVDASGACLVVRTHLHPSMSFQAATACGVPDACTMAAPRLSYDHDDTYTYHASRRQFKCPSARRLRRRTRRLRFANLVRPYTHCLTEYSMSQHQHFSNCCIAK